MTEKNNNFTKVLIVLVIASLALLAIVYVFNIATKDSGGNNLSTPNNIERTAKGFDDMGKMEVTGNMEVTDRCGYLNRCELKVFTEGNWQLAKKANIKYINKEKGIEIDIPDYESCSNEEYIIPPYSEGHNENTGSYFISYPFISNIFPCENSSYPNYTFINIYEKGDNDIDAYMNDFTLVKDDTDPNSLIKMEYNNKYIISYQAVGMLEFNCFLILGEEFQYNICKISQRKPREIDTSFLDNIKILK